EDKPAARRARSPRHPDAEPRQLPDRGGAAGDCRTGRRRRAVPVRARHLRHACRVPARASERGRLPPAGHGGEHGRRDRPPDRGARRPRGGVRAPAGGATGRMSVLRHSAVRRYVWALYLAVMAVLLGAYLWVPPLEGYPIVVNVIGVGSVA